MPALPYVRGCVHGYVRPDDGLYAVVLAVFSVSPYRYGSAQYSSSAASPIDHRYSASYGSDRLRTFA